MAKLKTYAPQGVIPAILLALHDDYSMDFSATRKHLRDVAAVDGMSALTIKGHASQVHACSFEEQRQILEASVDEIGDRLPTISGVYADGSFQAAHIARMAGQEGASASGLHLAPDVASAGEPHTGDATWYP